MPGIGGSNVSAPTTTGFPQAGQANVYQPQQQPTADYQYTNLINQLLQQYASGQTPGQEFGGPAGGVAATYQGAATDPFWYNLQQQLATNPYYPEAITAAQTGANYMAGAGPLQFNTYQDLLRNIPQYQANLASGLTGFSPAITALGQATSGYAPQAAAAAQSTLGLAPQLQGRVNQLNTLADYFGNLGSQAGGYQPAFAGLGQQVAGLAPGVESLARGVAGTIPAVNQLAGTVAGTLPQFQAGANRALGLIPEVAQQQQFLQGLERQPTGAGALRGAAGQLLQTGFDPQNALFNQLTQQTRDQANAINAASGLGGSPYAAGLTGDALRNLDIQWQNQQLAREATATGAAGTALGQAQGLNLGQAQLAQDVLAGTGLKSGLNLQALQALQGLGGQAGAAGGLYGAGAGLAGTAAGITGQAGNLLGQAGGLYGQGLGALTTAGNLYGQQAGADVASGGLTTALGNLYGSGVNQLAAAGGLNTAAANQYLGSAGLYPQAANIYGQAPQTAGANQALINALTQGAATAGGLPSQSYLGNLQSQVQGRNDLLGALSGIIPQITGAANIGQSQYQLPQTLLGDLSNYLELGRGASLAGGALGQIGTQQSQMGAAGLAGLGTLASPFVFGSGGLTGALGLNPSTGLLGGLGGILSGLFGGGGSEATSLALLTP